ELIQRMTQQKEAFSNFKFWLQKHGHDTRNMATLGASESLISVMERRMKDHRSWSDKGYDHLQQLVIAQMNGAKVVLPGEPRVFRLDHANEQKPLSAAQVLSKTGVQKTAAETLNEVLPYLKQPAGTPIYQALHSRAGY
ncbi:hypothetical protein EWH99_13945, partial [Sporolactobacillus sp. THM7-7]